MADPTAVAHVLTVGSDTNDVIGCVDVDSGLKAQGRVAKAGGIVKERTGPDRRVGVAGGVAIERTSTGGRVRDASVGKEGSKTDPYARFKAMLEAGDPPGSFADLLRASQALK